MLTPANFGYVADVKGYEYDLAKAKALVKEAGAEGEELPFITSPVYDQRIVQAIQQMLREVGLKVDDLAERPGDLPAPPPGPAAGCRQPLDRRWSCACQDADGVI